MSGLLLVLNAGSSSVKFAVFGVAGPMIEDLTPLSSGQVEGLGQQPRFIGRDLTRAATDKTNLAPGTGYEGAIAHLRGWLAERYSGAALIGIGHRVVHGGPDFAAPVVVTPVVLETLERFIPLAPLHQPHNLVPIRIVAAALPHLPQVACFDTAFHRGHPAVADHFALPAAFYDEGVRRYGFHGLSYEYITRTLPQVAPELAAGRVVIAHLGNGASLCAVRAGRSIDSSMGFTALDGLPMGTRCGALDAGVVLYLIQQRGMAPAEIEDLLYRRSGLLGVSGVSSDMRALLASDAPAAALAIDLFVYRIGQALGALAASLGGLDGIVFTAGIGENSPDIRARVCADAEWLGIVLDDAANRAGGPLLTRADSAVSAWVIPTDEERMIALHTLSLLAHTEINP